MKKQTYESGIRRLEEIVSALEAGELSLEDSLKLYEEGSRLASFCNKSLENAEQKITELSALEEKETGEQE